jgi:anti-anti-sigma factor
MTIQTRFSKNNETYTISIDGAFDFSRLNEFREAYSEETIQSAKIVVDLSKTETIDSSALGMLLNMQRFLKKSNGAIDIINCNSVVEKIFNITHFEKKFNIK